MKLNQDLANLLLDTKLNETKNKLPFLENFMSYTQGFTEIRDFWNYLYFLERTLNDYYKYKTRCSYQEYLNEKYPPQ